jgi:hypothetical protein
MELNNRFLRSVFMKKKIFMLIAIALLITGCGKEVKEETKEKNQKEEVKVEEKIDIIDLESNSRPYAVVINNFPSAVKVQTGLNDAYIVYEFPVEGGMTRSLALYKDKTTEKIGTVRSARHNFLDYAMENDAIFVHFGWSYHAEQQIIKLGIENIDGNYSDPSNFWRENPEGLASEHTAYTSLKKCEETAKNKGYKLTTTVKPPLNYTAEEVNLSDGNVANNVSISYSYSYGVDFVYDSETKLYKRIVNGIEHKDYFTKENYTTKNILVLKTNVEYTESNYYLELNNVGSGTGYYITNGYSKKITWEKKDRRSQTTYKYSDGTNVKFNDGNTYIMFRDDEQNLNIS